jgi:hypothetical protein
MGQDTRCNVGVTYHCQYIPENRELIVKLMSMEDVSAFISTEEHSDEVLEITDTIANDENMFNPEVLAKAAHDWYGYKDIEILGKEVIFKVNVYKAHVRNISRRHHGRPLYDACFKAVGMITTLQKIVEQLKSFGIKEKPLYIGHTFTDD